MLSARTLSRLSAVAVFLNSAPGRRGGQERPEQLTAGTQLPALVPDLQEGDVRLRVAAAALVRAHDLRGRVAEAWTLASEGDDDAATERVNGLLAQVGPLRLTAGEDSVDFAPATTPADAVERLAAMAALAMAEAAVDGELSRLRLCAGEDCENALVDASRNRSKRFCDEANCANRTHVRSYRARLAEQAAPDAPATGEDAPASEAPAADAPEARDAVVPAQAVDAAEHADAEAADLPGEEDAAEAGKKARKKAKKEKKKAAKKAKGDKGEKKSKKSKKKG